MPDNITGDPVADATVLITKLGLVTTTDEDGYYLFDEVPVGSYTLSCHAAGYKLPAYVPVTVIGPATARILSRGGRYLLNLSNESQL